jgi:urea transport system permease protein
MLMVFLVPGSLALAFGWLAFRSRIKGVYFSILTQALTFAGSLLFFRNDMVMGGNNGFTDFKFLLGADIRSPGTQRILFICTSVVLVGVYALCRWLTGSRFGLIQRAIRDSETRVLFSGYPVARFKLFIFVLSAFIASVGGALYVPQVGIINPSEMTPDKSLEAVVWCAVGGRGTLIGPIIGAIGVNWLKSWASHEHPEIWPILLGGLFIVVVVLMPGGIVGLPAQLKPWFARRRAGASGPPPASPQKPKPTPIAAETTEVTA